MAVNAGNLVNLAQNCAFTEEVRLLRIDNNVVKIACPITCRATLHMKLININNGAHPITCNFYHQCISS